MLRGGGDGRLPVPVQAPTADFFNPHPLAAQLCNLGALQPGCIIYSLGSNGDFSFEREMAARTPCHIHTFDCTVAASRIPGDLPARVTFHAVCLGSAAHVDKYRRRYATLPALAAELGHKVRGSPRCSWG